MRAIPLVVAVSTVAALAAALPAHAQQPALTPTSCERDAAPRTMCSTLTVPLDRTGVVPGTVELPVRVLPARGSAPHRGPLLLLAGGPGQAGIQDGDTAKLFASLAPGYDIVSYDQRGTGRTALRCPALSVADIAGDAVDAAPAEAITQQFGRCASELGDARWFYRSSDSAADIDALRAALGAKRITLGGTSYGTWVSQVYARLYPQHVERLVLDSVVGPQGVNGIARSEYAGAVRVVRQLCADGACRGITTSPVGDARKLAAQLDAEPLRGRAVDDRGRVKTISVGGPKQPGLVSGLLYGGDLDPYSRAAFPAAVRSALDGDSALLMRLIAAGGEDEDDDDPSEISAALYAATTCAETSLPWPATATPEQRRTALDSAVAALRPDELGLWPRTTVRTQPALAGCLVWPGAPFTGAPSGPLPNVPTLVLNGLDDVRTPVEDAVAVAAQIPRSTVVRIPNQGHSVFAQECARDALERFLADRTVSTNACRGKRTPDAPSLVPVPPRSLTAVGPRGDSARAKARRSTRAVRLSIRDAGLAVSLYEESPRAPGLRAGTASIKEADGQAVLELRNYGYVPGLRLTGRIVLGERWAGTLRVSGARSTARGTLTIRDGVARGRLGGVNVSLRL
ncbi:MAG: alpha/beta fold hydrolase [Patulibacter sp.]|nr:alpha/beta fold hydrolase [Patulibacter sp.]